MVQQGSPPRTKEEICGSPQVGDQLGSPAASPSQPEAAPPAATNGDTAYVSMQAGHDLLAVNPNEPPYKVSVPSLCVSGGERYASEVFICVATTGLVSSVELRKPSLPLIDDQLPGVIARWRYRPYLVDGRPTPFCYPLRYRVQ